MRKNEKHKVMQRINNEVGTNQNRKVTSIQPHKKGENTEPMRIVMQ